MNSLLSSKKIKKIKKELNDENKFVFEKIENRLLGSLITSNIYKENVIEVLNMLIEGQKRNESYKEVIGEDLDNFCEEIIENSYKPNIFKKIFRIIYFFSLALSIQLLFYVIFELFIYKENIILKAISGELPKVNIISYILWAATGVIYFLSQDLVVKTSLKKTSTHSLAIGLLLISFYLQKSAEKINLIYMIDVNYIFLILIIVLIITSYQVYNFKIRKGLK